MSTSIGPAASRLRPSACSLFRKLMYASSVALLAGQAGSPGDGEERLVTGESGEVQLLPDTLARVAIARAREAGPGHVVVELGLELCFAAQARQAIDEQHAVDVERLVEADQARMLAMPFGRLQPEEAREIDDAVEVAPQVRHAEEPAMAVGHRRHRRDGKDLAGIAQREEEAAIAALDREPRLAALLRARRLQALRQAVLQLAQG